MLFAATCSQGAPQSSTKRSLMHGIYGCIIVGIFFRIFFFTWGHRLLKSVPGIFLLLKVLKKKKKAVRFTVIYEGIYSDLFFISNKEIPHVFLLFLKILLNLYPIKPRHYELKIKSKLPTSLLLKTRSAG